MKKQDKDRVLACLEDGAKALAASVAALSPAQLVSAPPGSWSALGILEHVALTEPFLLRSIKAARAEAGQAPSDPAKDDLLVQRIIGRGRKVTAPEAVVPSGRFASAEAALAAFHQARRETLDFVHACGDDLRERHCQHPILGLIPAYNCLLLLAAHPARHAAQIREMFGDARRID